MRPQNKVPSAALRHALLSSFFSGFFLLFFTCCCCRCYSPSPATPFYSISLSPFLDSCSFLIVVLLCPQRPAAAAAAAPTSLFFLSYSIFTTTMVRPAIRHALATGTTSWMGIFVLSLSFSCCPIRIARFLGCIR